MNKVCVVCNDGKRHSEDSATCPTCGNFLRLQSNSKPSPAKAAATPVDEFADFFSEQGSAAIDQEIVPPLTQAAGSSPQVNQVKSETKVAAVEGTLRNLQTDTIPEGFLKRWMRSFSKGIPYVRDGTLTKFQVYPDEGTSGNEVILYGKVIRGSLAERNRVKVWGKRDSTNAIVATRVENKDVNTTVMTNFLFNAAVVRFITTLILAFLVIGIIALTTVNWGLVFNYVVYYMVNILLILTTIIILLLILWFIFRKMFR